MSTALGAMLALRSLIGLVVVLVACQGLAHDVRPGYLEVREVAPSGPVLGLNLHF